MMGSFSVRDDEPTALIRRVGESDCCDLWLTQTSVREGQYEIEFHAICDGIGTATVNLACAEEKEVHILLVNTGILLTGFVVRFELIPSSIEADPLTAKFWMVLSRSTEKIAQSDTWRSYN